jgi:hypothetical protein
MNILKTLRNQTRGYYRQNQKLNCNYVLLSVDRDGNTRKLGIYTKMTEPLEKIELLKLHNKYKKESDANYVIQTQNDEKIKYFEYL